MTFSILFWHSATVQNYMETSHSGKWVSICLIFSKIFTQTSIIPLKITFYIISIYAFTCNLIKFTSLFEAFLWEDILILINKCQSTRRCYQIKQICWIKLINAYFNSLIQHWLWWRNAHATNLLTKQHTQLHVNCQQLCCVLPKSYMCVQFVIKWSAQCVENV